MNTPPGVLELLALMRSYQREYDTPCPDLTLRHRIRADLFLAIDKFPETTPPPRASLSGEVELLCRIGDLIRTQDNRITSHPVFVVEQKRSYVTDPDYNDAREIWVDDEGDDAEPRSKGSRKIFVHDVWEFVTACFTEQGCNDYLKANGHNLREPRIYVHSAWRNAEWIGLREYFSSLPPTPGESK